MLEHLRELLDAVEVYKKALGDYARSDGQDSYSVIELPKLEIANVVLKALGVPLRPKHWMDR